MHSDDENQYPDGSVYFLIEVAHLSPMFSYYRPALALLVGRKQQPGTTTRASLSNAPGSISQVLSLVLGALLRELRVT